MSDYIPKNGEITVWINDKFTEGGNQPYIKGRGKNLDGTLVDVALWTPKSEKMAGMAFNMTIKEAWQKEPNPAPQNDVPAHLQQAPVGNQPTVNDDDLPF